MYFNRFGEQARGRSKSKSVPAIFLPDAAVEDQISHDFITNVELKMALESKEQYDNYWMELTFKIITSFQISEQHRKVLRLNEDIAMLHLYS
jgi:hypothetical protein